MVENATRAANCGNQEVVALEPKKCSLAPTGYEQVPDLFTLISMLTALAAPPCAVLQAGVYDQPGDRKQAFVG
jgi:hypothetical protein